MPVDPPAKLCIFVGSSQRDLREFPAHVRSEIGHVLHDAQLGAESYSAKALKGFSGRGVLEIVADFDGDTYWAVYTVRFAGAGLCPACLSEEV